jgi:hypothetical protein
MDLDQKYHVWWVCECHSSIVDPFALLSQTLKYSDPQSRKQSTHDPLSLDYISNLALPSNLFDLMLPYDAPERSLARALFDNGLTKLHNATTTHLVQEMMKLDRTLPQPTKTIKNKWAAIPNHSIPLSPPLGMNKHITAAPDATSRTCVVPVQQVDSYLEARLKSTTADPHDFVIYRDPQPNMSRRPDYTSPSPGKTTIDFDESESEVSGTYINRAKSAPIPAGTTLSSTPTLTSASNSSASTEDTLDCRRPVDDAHGEIGDQILSDGLELHKIGGAIDVAYLLFDFGTRTVLSVEPIIAVAQRMLKALELYGGILLSINLRKVTIRHIKRQWKPVSATSYY